MDGLYEKNPEFLDIFCATARMLYKICEMFCCILVCFQNGKFENKSTSMQYKSVSLKPTPV